MKSTMSTSLIMNNLIVHMGVDYVDVVENVVGSLYSPGNIYIFLLLFFKVYKSTYPQCPLHLLKSTLLVWT